MTKNSMFVFNPSHDEVLNYFVGILPHSIFNRKIALKFQKLIFPALIYKAERNRSLPDTYKREIPI